MKNSLFDTLRSFLSSLFKPSLGEKEVKEDRGDAVPVKLSRPFTLVDDCNRDDPLLKEMMECRR